MVYLAVANTQLLASLSQAGMYITGVWLQGGPSHVATSYLETVHVSELLAPSENRTRANKRYPACPALKPPCVLRLSGDCTGLGLCNTVPAAWQPYPISSPGDSLIWSEISKPGLS